MTLNSHFSKLYLALVLVVGLIMVVPPVVSGHDDGDIARRDVVEITAVEPIPNTDDWGNEEIVVEYSLTHSTHQSTAGSVEYDVAAPGKRKVRPVRIYAHDNCEPAEPITVTITVKEVGADGVEDLGTSTITATASASRTVFLTGPDGTAEVDLSFQSQKGAGNTRPCLNTTPTLIINKTESIATGTFTTQTLTLTGQLPTSKITGATTIDTGDLHDNHVKVKSVDIQSTAPNVSFTAFTTHTNNVTVEFEKLSSGTTDIRATVTLRLDSTRGTPAKNLQLSNTVPQVSTITTSGESKTTRLTETPTQPGVRQRLSQRGNTHLQSAQPHSFSGLSVARPVSMEIPVMQATDATTSSNVTETLVPQLFDLHDTGVQDSGKTRVKSSDGSTTGGEVITNNSAVSQSIEIDLIVPDDADEDGDKYNVTIDTQESRAAGITITDASLETDPSGSGALVSVIGTPTVTAEENVTFTIREAAAARNNSQISRETITLSVTLNSSRHNAGRFQAGEVINHTLRDSIGNSTVNVTYHTSATSAGQLFTQVLPGSGGQGPPKDPDGDGNYEDINGDGNVTFDDAVSLAFVDDSQLSQAQIDAIDQDGDGDIDFDDAIDLAFDPLVT